MTREIVRENEIVLNNYSECYNFKIIKDNYFYNKIFWLIRRGSSNCQMNIVGEGHNLIEYIFFERYPNMSDEDFNEQKEERKEQVLNIFKHFNFANNVLFDVKVEYLEYLKELFGKDIIFHKKYTNTYYGTKMVMVYAKVRQ